MSIMRSLFFTELQKKNRNEQKRLLRLKTTKKIKKIVSSTKPTRQNLFARSQKDSWSNFCSQAGEGRG